jgi:hypothetical protein
MPDRFSGQAAGLTSPANDGFPITPSDTDELPELARAIYVGNSGTLVVELASGAVLAFSGLQSGTILPIRAHRVRATGTTAGALVGHV